ncbi:aspartate dehydrogenase [Sulfitobacter sp. JB4-11]|uniref:aspartate dehydrogenase n=1 Tax=Sulfitobacter rhodophyticola TaxID=3238304 RepID=UPI003511DDE0
MKRADAQGPVALIGFGAIGRTLVDALCNEGIAGGIVVLVREDKVAEAQTDLKRIVAGRSEPARVVSHLDDVIKAQPRVVVECAGHAALGQFGGSVLAAGIDLIVASVGALADDELLDGIRKAAIEGNAQITLPAGAIGGIDALAAARIAGIEQVVYIGRKPPQAWAGSPAEAAVDLSGITKETVIFEDTARQAARRYPKNANVAATLALAGIGMDRTDVRLIADPGVTTNTHEYRVVSSAVDFSMVLTGKPSLLNPKTSQLTVFSLARAVLQRSDRIVI